MMTDKMKELKEIIENQRKRIRKIKRKQMMEISKDDFIYIKKERETE